MSLMGKQLKFLKRVIKLLPPTLSDTEVERLRAQFPPMLAAEDPATDEFSREMIRQGELPAFD